MSLPGNTLQISLVPLCPGRGPTRSPTWYEANWAELLIWEYFRRDFTKRFGPPALVIGQLEYLSLLTGNKTIDDFLTRMARDFRNELSRAALRKDISSDRPGRNLKPDILGIAPTADGRVFVELVEVTTVRQADKTLEEDVQHKLQVLKEKVITQDTRLLGTDYYATSGKNITFQVYPSHWRPAWDQMVFPLPTTVLAGRNQVVEWICYQPTFDYNPPTGTNGLVLYEIHRVGLPGLVPKEVLDKLAEEIKRKKAARLREQALTLTPWVDDSYWRQNARDRDLLLAVCTISAVALVALLAVTVGPALLAAAGGGAAAEAVMGGAVVMETAEGAAVVTQTATASGETMSVVSGLMQSLGRPLILAPVGP